MIIIEILDDGTVRGRVVRDDGDAEAPRLDPERRRPLPPPPPDRRQHRFYYHRWGGSWAKVQEARATLVRMVAARAGSF